MSCCGRKLLITEEEKKHILSLYGLIKEDPDPVSETSTSAIKIDKTINFAPGYYRHKGPVTTKAGTTYDWDVDKTLKDELQKIREFLKNNPTGYIVEANLYSGESRIPNSDNEKGIEVKENYLNEARLNSLKSYLNPIFELWKTEGITKTDFKINEYKKIGDTKWVDTPFCPANTPNERSCTTTYFTRLKTGDQTAKDYKAKYDAEQYFRVVIEVKKVETSVSNKTTENPTTTTTTTVVKENCATGLKIRVDVEQHDCNNAEFFLFLNDTMLYNVDGGYTANGNNSNSYIDSDSGKKIKAKRLNPGYGKLSTKKYGVFGDLGGVRYDEFIVTPEQSKKIVEQSNEGKINVWYICTLASGCHLDTPTVKIFKNDLPIYEGKPMSDSALLITLDSCGNKASDIIDTSGIEPNVDTIRNKIQTDRMSMVIDNEKDVPDKQDTKQKELKASNTLNTMMDYINKLFTHPSIKSIYLTQSNVQPKVYQSTGVLNGKTSYVNYNLPQNKELFDWFKSKIEDKTLLMYIDEIKRLIIQNNYQIKDGVFVDKNLRTNKLFGDVRHNLEKFYTYFNDQFDMDENGDITLKYVDESYPLNYARILSKVSNPGTIYTLTPIKV
jgi:hypothetical protein